MSFAWNENVAADELITKAAMEEMRDNIDLVVDNLADCFEHNAAYNADQDIAWDLQDNVTWHYNHDSGYDSGLETTFRVIHYTSNLSGYNWVYRSAYYTDYRLSDKTNYK